MKLGGLVKSFAKKLGSQYKIYDLDGIFLGIDDCFINPIKRSANENIAEFGREGIFHYQTLLQPGVIVKDEFSGEELFVSSKRAVKIKNRIVTWSVFLVKINALATIKRNTMAIADIDTVEFSYSEVLIAENVPAYLRKEDWTMEAMGKIGRVQKGYETLVVQDSYDVVKGDLVYINDNKYIAQYFVRYAKEGYNQIQLGIDV